MGRGTITVTNEWQPESVCSAFGTIGALSLVFFAHSSGQSSRSGQGLAYGRAGATVAFEQPHTKLVESPYRSECDAMRGDIHSTRRSAHLSGSRALPVWEPVHSL